MSARAAEHRCCLGLSLAPIRRIVPLNYKTPPGGDVMRKWLAFGLAWALILGGAYLAHSIQTSGGTTVTEVRKIGRAHV